MRAAVKEILTAMLTLSLSFTVMPTLAAGDKMSMVPKDCPDKCGCVSIYYPFGIGPRKDCYLSKWFLINCTKSSDGAEKPYLSSFSNDRAGAEEILYISLHPQTIRIKESISASCQTAGSAERSNFSIIRSTKLSGSAFFYSSVFNEFMLFGCGGASLTRPGENKTVGCWMNCNKNMVPKTADDCNGTNCRHLPFEYDVNTYQINFTGSSVKACKYAFFLSKQFFPHSLQMLPSSQQEDLIVPVEWCWTITTDDLPRLPPSHSVCSLKEYIYPQLRGRYWNCHCKHPEGGNGYLASGC